MSYPPNRRSAPFAPRDDSRVSRTAREQARRAKLPIACSAGPVVVPAARAGTHHAAATARATGTLTVYTTVLGETDHLRPPRVVNPAIRYVCFADRWLHVPPYETVLVDSDGLGPRLHSRQLKILADHSALDHPGVGPPAVTLWHDAAYELIVDPAQVVVSALGNHDLLAFKHPHRCRIEDEAVAIAKIGYVEPMMLLQQIATYRTAGFPFRQQQITSTGYCIRRMTAAVRRFSQLWWNEVARWGWRDQMSVDYVIWQTQIRVSYIPGHYRDNPYAIWHLDPRAGRAVAPVVRPIAGAITPLIARPESNDELDSTDVLSTIDSHYADV